MFRINKKGKLIIAVLSFLILTPLIVFYVLDGTGVFDTRSEAGESSLLPEKFKPADLNADNIINISDFSIWLDNFRQFKRSPTAFSAMADLNNDAVIAVTDFSIWLALWREYKATGQPVNPPVTPPVVNLTMLGTGADGDITVNSDVNISTSSMAVGRSCADAKAYSVVRFDSDTVAVVNQGVDAACIKAGDEVLVIGLSGTDTNSETVGNYETFIVSSTAGDKVTFTTAKTKSFGSKIILQRVPQYRNVNIVAGKTLSSSSWNGTEGGVIFFRATGTVNVEGIISANGAGYRGGTAGTRSGLNGGGGGEAFCGGNNIAGGAGGNGIAASVTPGAGACGGGGGAGNDDNTTAVGGLGSVSLGGAGGGGGTNEDTSHNAGYNRAGGGGGGGYGTFGYKGGSVDTASDGVDGGTNTSGNGGKGKTFSSSNHTAGGGGGGGTYGDVNLGRLFFGASGGGGGQGEAYGTAGAGGNGGGIIYIAANTITVTGVISANGVNGGKGVGANYDDGGGGGGGAGGSIKLVGNILNVGVGKTTANGGLGGAAGQTTASGGNKGGDGGSGRIRIEYVTTFTGSTTPVSSNARI